MTLNSTLHLKLDFLKLLIFILAVYSFTAHPQDFKQSIYKTAIMISSADKSICGSGILLKNGEIITAAHLAKRLCTQLKCPSLIISRSNNQGLIKHTDNNYVLITLLESFDTALLKPLKTPLKGYHELSTIKTEIIPQSFDKITVASYPSCKRLKIANGHITENYGMKFNTTAMGQAGSSGGVIYNSRGQIIGIVTRAVSEWEAFWGRITGSSFTLKGQIIEPTISKNGVTYKSLLKQVSILHTFIEEISSNNKDTPQYKWLSLEITKAVNGLRNQLSFNHKIDANYLRPLTYIGRYPTDLLDAIIVQPLDTPSDKLQKALEQLILKTSLEQKGLKKDFITTLNIKKYLNQLNARPDLQEILKSYRSHRSSDYLWLNFCVRLATIITIIFVIYGFSLGYVFSQEKYWLKKIFITLIVGLLLWPISLCIYLIVKKYYNIRTSP